jgi:hypothetical protein
MRQDDNGKVYLVKAGLSFDEARALADEFERRGHKQHYMVERVPEPPLAEPGGSERRS